MNANWFEEWVEMHCIATGANDAARQAIIANRGNLLDAWRATLEELGQVTARLVANLRTPKFPNEHCDAVGRELAELRAERAALPPAVVPGDSPACDACQDTGIVTVPHPECVWSHRIVLHREQRCVITTTVLCDRSGCAAGYRAQAADDERAKSKTHRRMARLSAMERLAGCDVLALLRAHEAEVVRRARLERGDSPLAGVFRSILRRCQEAATTPESHHEPFREAA